MTATPLPQRTLVRLWFDPACPFAWITSRWLMELEKRGEVGVQFAVMSLAVLDEHNEVPDDYRVRMPAFWGPVRVAVATENQYGQSALRELYSAMGTVRHVRGERLDADGVRASLVESGLPSELADAADDPAWDQAVRDSHARGVALVGSDVGTPILQTPEGAIFGPILTRTPRGPSSLQLWNNIRGLVADEDFFELKRSRTRVPTFD